MDKMAKIKMAASKMALAQLKNEASVLADRLSKMSKEDRQTAKYTDGMAAWKILRLEIGEKQNANK